MSRNTKALANLDSILAKEEGEPESPLSISGTIRNPISLATEIAINTTSPDPPVPQFSGCPIVDTPMVNREYLALQNVSNPPLTTTTYDIPETPVAPLPSDMTIEATGRGIVPAIGVMDPDLNRFIEELAPPEELRMALSYAGSEKAIGFLSDIVNIGKYEKKLGRTPTMAALAKKNGIGMDTLAEIWRNYSLSKGMMKWVGRAPEIASDTADDALSTEMACPRCDGWGTISRPDRVANGIPIEGEEKSCPQCKGNGIVRKAGDSDARKQIFEAIGWTGKRAAAVQINVSAHSIDSVIGDLESASKPIDTSFTDIT